MARTPKPVRKVGIRSRWESLRLCGKPFKKDYKGHFVRWTAREAHVTRGATRPKLYESARDLPPPVSVTAPIRACYTFVDDTWDGKVFVVTAEVLTDPPVPVRTQWMFSRQKGATWRTLEIYIKALEAGLLTESLEIRTDVYGEKYIRMEESGVFWGWRGSFHSRIIRLRALIGRADRPD